MDDLAAAVQTHLEDLKHEPVVSLVRTRHLHRLLRDLQSTNPVVEGIAYIESTMFEVLVFDARWLLDRVERVLEGAGPGDVADLARQVTRDYEFQRISRIMRRTRASFDAFRPELDERIPIVDVPAYTRQGRPVRGYSRYVGYVHLKGLPGLAERPEVVQQVIGCIIDGSHFRLRAGGAPATPPEVGFSDADGAPR